MIELLEPFELDIAGRVYTVRLVGSPLENEHGRTVLYTFDPDERQVLIDESAGLEQMMISLFGVIAGELSYQDRPRDPAAILTEAAVIAAQMLNTVRERCQPPLR